MIEIQISVKIPSISDQNSLRNLSFFHQESIKDIKILVQPDARSITDKVVFRRLTGFFELHLFKIGF